MAFQLTIQAFIPDIPVNSLNALFLRRRVLALILSALSAAMVALPAAAQSAPPIKLALIEGLSGPFANAGEAVFRNLQWGVERVNAQGGVKVGSQRRPLELVRMDSKGSADDAVQLLRQATQNDIRFVFQGNSSGVAAALIDAVEKNNQREPERRALFLNYSAVEPSLTNEKCSFWHFRFDAHADMRLAALTDQIRDDKSLKKVYLIGQDYSFGQYVVKRSEELIRAKRPDIQVVGEELHAMGKVKDFLPYATKIKLSGAQAVVTGNWGNDLTLLVKAVKEVGGDVRFFTFYGNALGVPGALGEAGVGAVMAVSEWHANDEHPGSAALVQAFRQRFPQPKDDYLHLRMQFMVDMLAQALEKAGSVDALAVARALEGMKVDAKAFGGLGAATGAYMRAEDHQFQQPLIVSSMDKQGSPGVRFDVEGSGYGFKTVKKLSTEQAALSHSCKMQRPAS